jgi:two-component system, NtrC family, response regulator HydG
MIDYTNQNDITRSMKASDLDLRELLEVGRDDGIVRFAGQRALILDAVALGLLRKELVEALGATVAQGVLARFGYIHGWRTAESLKDAFPWDSERDWRTAGGRLHTLQGMVVFEPVPPSGDNPPFAESIWRQSYEAEQHLLHLGQAEDPVCWTLTGFATGYLSYCNGKEIVCLEIKCRGKGDAVCHMVGRPREEWGEERLPAKMCEKVCLEGALQSVTEALKRTETRLRRRKQELARAGGLAEGEDPSGMIVRSEPMRRILDVARRVAKVDSSVLVTGESGVGKERVARVIHDESPRAGRAFVAVNCSAVSESLLESELFGHARGAFTGATTDRAGLFEAASGGTLFLDEVGEIPLPMQAKLLRALQEKEVRRVGENKNRAVDVRVVAATNRDLAEEVAAGRFRKDLYYRLRVVELRVPPLRDRKDDVLPLARLLLADASRRMSRPICSLSPEAANQLLRYDWPGNVRELSNAMERAVALAEHDRVDVDDLPEEVRAAFPTPTVAGGVKTLEEVEREYILSALESNGGNQSRTAEQLQIGTATLYRKLRKWGRGSVPTA